MNLALSLLLISGLTVSAPVAGDLAQHDWKAWLDTDTRAASFSGVALIGRGDAVQIVSAYGLADRSTGRPNTADTRFNLGSINKTFTAIAVAQLIQQGRLSLDDTLAKYLPDYPNRDAAARITIHQLVTHRSGIASFVRADFGDAISVADMAKVVGSEPQAFEPGARQEYSNGGYVVLGRVVEVVSGQSYAAYVSDHIYRPAGMTSSGFLGKGEGDPAVALGYFSTDAQGHPVMGGQTGIFGFHPPEPGNPAGGGYSTAADLFKFSRALRGGRLLDQRMTDYVLNGTFLGQSGPKFGFALKEQMAGPRRFVGNGGGAPGVNAEFRFEPAGKSTVIVLANSSPPAATKLLTDIMDRLAPGSAAETPSPQASAGARRSEGQGLQAGDAPRAPAAFDRKAVVSSVADRVEELYVDPKIGKALAEHLRRRLNEGAFNSCAAPSALADALTRALREVADDKHLSVRAGGAMPARLRASALGPGPAAGNRGPPGKDGSSSVPGRGPRQAPVESPRARAWPGSRGWRATSDTSPSPASFTESATRKPSPPR